MEIEKKRNRLLEILLWLLALIHIYPILLVLISALKTRPDLATNPFGLPKQITLEHFQNAFKTMNYFRSTFNSALITGIAVFILVLITSMGAYAIIRKNNKFYNLLYIFFMAGMVVPFQMSMIPLYKLMLGLHLINTYHGIIFIYLAILTPFSLFLFTGFIKTVPKELEESAVIDGCGIYGTFFKIVFPLLKPAIATIAVLDSFNIWNDFLQPLLFLTSRDMKTLVVQLFSYVGQYFNNWSPIFAAIFLIVYPMLIIYLFAQRSILKGLTAGAIKG